MKRSTSLLSFLSFNKGSSSSSPSSSISSDRTSLSPRPPLPIKADGEGDGDGKGEGGGGEGDERVSMLDITSSTELTLGSKARIIKGPSNRAVPVQQPLTTIKKRTISCGDFTQVDGQRSDTRRTSPLVAGDDEDDDFFIPEDDEDEHDFDDDDEGNDSNDKSYFMHHDVDDDDNKNNNKSDDDDFDLKGYDGSALAPPVGILPKINESVAFVSSRLSCGPPYKSSLKSARSSPTRGCRRDKGNCKVSFTTVTVRVYEQSISDNPSCKGGPPIGLDWSYAPPYSVAVPSASSGPSTSEVYMYTKKERAKMLLKAGYARRDILKAEKEAKKIRRERVRSVLMYGLFGY